MSKKEERKNNLGGVYWAASAAKQTLPSLVGSYEFEFVFCGLLHPFTSKLPERIVSDFRAPFRGLKVAVNAALTARRPDRQTDRQRVRQLVGKKGFAVERLRETVFGVGPSGASPRIPSSRGFSVKTVVCKASSQPLWRCVHVFGSAGFLLRSPRSPIFSA